MMKYKMIIFDLDGTILNTIEDLKEACNYALQKFNLEEITTLQTEAYLGHGIKNLIFQASHKDARVEELLQAFKDFYAVNYDQHTKDYDGIMDVFDWCLQHQIKLGVYTNKVEKIARNLCQSHFGDRFSFVYGEVEARKRKPDPTFLWEILKEYDLEAKDILYIGDSEVDIDLCQNAKIDGLFVSYGFRSKEKLGRLTNRIVDTPQEIILFLEKSEKEFI